MDRHQDTTGLGEWCSTHQRSLGACLREEIDAYDWLLAEARWTEEHGLFDDGPPPIAFIQWKGTDVCMDFHCTCGAGPIHFDTDFAYFIRCPQCRTLWRMGSHVRAEKVEPTHGDYEHLEYAKESDSWVDSSDQDHQPWEQAHNSHSTTDANDDT